MTYAERVHRWNGWYDDLPDRWRFQLILWPLLLIATINMMLTIANGFPFGLLMLVAILALAVVRIPYKVGFVKPQPGSEHTEQTVHLGRVDWAWNLNQRYDALPEWRRFWIFPAVLIVAGGINMALTLGNGFPFGLLFLLALLIMVAIRAPYVWGWLSPPGDTPTPSLRVSHDTTPSMPAFSQPAFAPAAAPIAAAPATPMAPPANQPPTIEHGAPEPPPVRHEDDAARP